MYLSVVIPVFNEEESIEITLDRVLATMTLIDVKHEIIIVNDGSNDKTQDIIQEKSAQYPSIRLINLAKNSGHMSALTAGLDHATGRWVVTLDGDGQDPPEMIPNMIELATSEAADICFMVRTDRKQDGLRHRIFSPLFYKVLSRATKGKAPLQAADFRLMSDRVLSELRKLPETNRIYRVITAELGFKSVTLEYSRNSRFAGESKYRFIRLAVLAIRSLIATSGAPLRWLSNFSIGIAGCAFLYSCFVFISGLFASGPPGWASLSLLLSTMLFIQALALAVISEFLLSILADVRKRPLYQVKDERFGK